MKILFAVDNLHGGGAQKLVNDISAFLTAKKGYSCEVLVLSGKEERYISDLENRGVHVEIIAEDKKSHFARVRYMAKYISENDFDVVHANLFPIIYYCALIKKLHFRTFPKLIMTEHNTYNRRRAHRFFRPIERFIYKSYDHVIAVSDKVQESLLDWLKPGKKELKKFSVVYNGIPLDDFVSAAPYEKDGLLPGFAAGDIMLCMVGSFKEQKNHEFIIEVMAILPEKYKLLLVGDGELVDDIRRKAKEHNLGNRVSFTGFRRDVPQILHTADIVVIPSKWEGFGMIVAEAMASEKPVVASDVPGLSEVVGDAGIKAPLQPRAFADAIISLSDTELYEKYSQRAGERSKIFSIEATCERYCDLFEGR